MGIEKQRLVEEAEDRRARNEFYKLCAKRGDPRYREVVEGVIEAYWPGVGHVVVPEGSYLRVRNCYWLPYGAALRVIHAQDRKKAYGQMLKAIILRGREQSAKLTGSEASDLRAAEKLIDSPTEEGLASPETLDS